MLRLRQDAKMSQLAAGLAIDVSKQTIGRLENGELTRISGPEYRELLSLYGADDETSAEVMVLVRQVRDTNGAGKGSWWRDYADSSTATFDHFLALEQAADRVSEFALTLLPGLAQTPAYRRWIETTTDPNMSAVEVERRLESTAMRQRRLTADPAFRLSVVLAESAVRHPVGGRAVMAEQCRHLVELSALPTVTVRAVPYAAHPGLITRSVILFDFPALSTARVPERPVAYIESYTGELLIEDPGTVERYRVAIAAVSAVALSEVDTREWLSDIAKEHDCG